jgi:hypothetical protein
MKKSFFIILTLFTSLSSFAQEAPKNLADSLKIGFWDKRDTKLSIDLSAAGFNDIWISNKGGTRNTAIGLLFTNRSVYHKNKWAWTTDMKFQFGTMKSKDQGSTFRKNLDLILLDTKYARTITKQLNWFVGVNFLSQLAPDYLYDSKTYVRGEKISALFAPAYLSEGIGVEWKPKPYFVVQFGGATLRQTFVTNDEVYNNKYDAAKDAAYGVPKGQKVLNEMGFNIVVDFKKEIVKNVSLGCRYQGFKAFAPKNKPIDSFLSADLTGKINKYLGVRGSLILIQDKDIAEDWLTSYGGGIGLVFTL